MATAPVFTDTLNVGEATISTANTNRDGSGTITTVLTADATNGTRVEHIDIKAIETTTAGMVRLYINDGSTNFLWKEVVVTAITVSASVAGFSESIDCSKPENMLLLPAGYLLRAAPHNAESFNVIAFGSDF